MKQLSSLALLVSLALPATLAAQPTPDASAHARVQASFGTVPLVFEENRGQTDPSVRFLSRGPGYALFLTGDAAVLALGSGGANDVIRMRLDGARPSSAITGEDGQPGTINRFTGRDASRWETRIPTFGRVRYTGVYPGVDAIYYGNQRQLEYDFVLAPGVDPAVVRLRFDGAKEVRIDPAGDLVLRAGGGEIRQPKPIVYQMVAGVRHEIDGRYVRRGRHQFGFAVGTHDPALPLVIDPVLSYATYLGSAAADADGGTAITVDPQGRAVITGRTFSTAFPTTPGSFHTIMSGGGDAFVAMLNPTGTALVFSTFLGGNAYEDGNDVLLDPAGNIYIAGTTTSTDFPTTAGAYRTSNAGGNDGFITKLNPTGSSLIYSTYIGGSADDFAQSRIARDASNRIYVALITASSDLPTTPDAVQHTYSGGIYDGYVVRLNAAGSGVEYASYLGGADMDFPVAMAVDATGNFFVTGWTFSFDFPTTPGVFSTTHSGGGFDGFVTKFSGSTGALIYSTYLGGSGTDIVNGLVLDATGNAIVVGETGSADFPTTPGTLSTTLHGSAFDGFVTKLNASGSGVMLSTFVGGNDFDTINAVAIDADGWLYLAGGTASLDFPTTPLGHQLTYGGSYADAFLAVLKADFSGLEYSTYFGGTGQDVGAGVATDGNKGAYVIGSTESPNLSTPGAVQPAIAGGYDVLIFKVAVVPPQPSNANAGPDRTVDSCPTCPVQVTLDASASTDPQHRAMTYTWSEGTNTLATSSDPAKTVSVPLAIGVHTITLTVGNGTGLTATDTVVITVRDVLAGAVQQLAQLQAAFVGAMATVAARDTTIAALQSQVTSLQAQVAALTAQLASLSVNLAQAFNSPTFTIPGSTPQEQVQNLVTAIGKLNHGQQQALYKNLGGK